MVSFEDWKFGQTIMSTESLVPVAVQPHEEASPIWCNPYLEVGH